jgi:hypothetical protein
MNKLTTFTTVVKLIVCFACLFHSNETKATDLKEDTIYYKAIVSQILNDENCINSFCRDKKMTIYKGKKDDCLFSDKYLKSIFWGVRMNGRGINIDKLAYCLKSGYVKISDNSKESSDDPTDYLVYDIVTFEKKNTHYSGHRLPVTLTVYRAPHELFFNFQLSTPLNLAGDTP